MEAGAAADGIVRAEAEKNEEENAPAGSEALVSEEDAAEEARLRGVSKGRSGKVGLRESQVVQGISSSL
jgi:hypothetical protein